MGVKIGDNGRKPFGLLLLGAGCALRRDCLAATGTSLRLSDWGFGLRLRRNCLTATFCGLRPAPEGTVSLDPILRKTRVLLFRVRVTPYGEMPPATVCGLVLHPQGTASLDPILRKLLVCFPGNLYGCSDFPTSLFPWDMGILHKKIRK